MLGLCAIASHSTHYKNVGDLCLFSNSGDYAVYWYYSTLKELHIANGKDEGAGLWTVLALIPIANLFSWWHYSSEADTFTSGKYSSVVLFIVWIIFSPIVWLLVQMELNKAAKGETRQQTVFQNP